jgi:PAS domain S-box-containing protein
MRFDQAAQEKAMAAERDVGFIRGAVVGFNVLIFWTLLDHTHAILWMAATISVVASAYTLFVVLARPYRRYPILSSSLFTTLSDGALIVFWIWATGGYYSPFYVIWYISLAAVAYRFNSRISLIACVAYSAAYLSLLAAIGHLFIGLPEVLTRTAYILMVGGLGALIARETSHQTRAKVGLRQLAAEETPVVGELQLDRALQRVVHTALRMVDADRGAVFLRKDDDELSCPYASGLSTAYLQARRQAFKDLPGYEVFADLPFVQVADAQTDPRLERLQTTIRREGFRTYAVFPLRMAGQTIGALALYRDRVRPFSDLEVELAQTLAAQGVIAIQNSRLLEELQAKEERFRAVAETANDGILSVAENGTIVYCNPAGATILGGQPEKITGRRIIEFMAPPESAARAFWREGNGEGIGLQELDARRMDNTPFLAEVSFAAAPAAGETVYTGIFRDATARRRLEEERAQNIERAHELERLRELNQFKTQFINTAAHELGTPLTPIRLQIQILRDEQKRNTPAEQRRGSLDILERNVERLITLVEDILEGARLQANRLGVQMEAMDVNRIVLESVESFHELAVSQGVRLETKLSPNLHVEADAKRITQVLFNLIDNAIKFTPSGGSVHVETRRTEDMVLVAVRDTGAGIRPELVSRLFQPFSQVHDVMQRTRSGTGLGLYICKGIVELHGGRIWVESPGPGLGSTFSFALPRHRAADVSLSHGATAMDEAARAEEIRRRSQDLV